MPIEASKAVVGRWFTEFWGKDFNPDVIGELAAPDIRFEYSLHAPLRGRGAAHPGPGRGIAVLAETGGLAGGRTSRRPHQDPANARSQPRRDGTTAWPAGHTLARPAGSQVFGGMNPCKRAAGATTQQDSGSWLRTPGWHVAPGACPASPSPSTPMT